MVEHYTNKIHREKVLLVPQTRLFFHHFTLQINIQYLAIFLISLPKKKEEEDSPLPADDNDDEAFLRRHYTNNVMWSNNEGNLIKIHYAPGLLRCMTTRTKQYGKWVNAAIFHFVLLF